MTPGLWLMTIGASCVAFGFALYVADSKEPPRRIVESSTVRCCGENMYLVRDCYNAEVLVCYECESVTEMMTAEEFLALHSRRGRI